LAAARSPGALPQPAAAPRAAPARLRRRRRRSARRACGRTGEASGRCDEPRREDSAALSRRWQTAQIRYASARPREREQELLPRNLPARIACDHAGRPMALSPLAARHDVQEVAPYPRQAKPAPVLEAKAEPRV